MCVIRTNLCLGSLPPGTYWAIAHHDREQRKCQTYGNGADIGT